MLWGVVRLKVIFQDEGWRGDEVKSDFSFVTKGEGGLAEKGFRMTRGEGGTQTSPKKDDIICEQPLIIRSKGVPCNQLAKGAGWYRNKKDKAKISRIKNYT